MSKSSRRTQLNPRSAGKGGVSSYRRLSLRLAEQLMEAAEDLVNLVLSSEFSVQDREQMRDLSREILTLLNSVGSK